MSGLDRLVAAGVVRAGVALAPLTTYRLGGPARYFAEPDGEDELAAIVDAWRADGGAATGPPLLVLGRGSNLVIGDAGFAGIVIRLGRAFARIVIAPDGILTAGGAAPLPKVARTAVAAGRGGLEFLVGIPGSVGGAVRMNAGCHGSETSDWLASARVLDMAAGTRRDVPVADLGLGYRRSGLGRWDAVLGGSFRTETIDPPEGERIIREITRWRRDTQPGGTLNAGSAFKNPPGDAAGRIIDHLGLKGFAVRGASVSTRHANFFVAAPDATGQDVYDLVWAVRRRVGEATGVWLEPEIKFAGQFATNDDRAAGPAPSP